MFCKNCGMQLEDGAKFCKVCGSQVDNAVGDNVIYDNTNRKSVKKKGKGVIVILVVIIALAMLFLGGSSAEDVAQEFMESILEGNGKKCASLMTDDAVERTGSETRKILINTLNNALADLREEYKSKYGEKWKYEVVVIDSYEITGEYYSGEYIGDAVEVVMEIRHTGSGLFKDKDGTETETVILVKEDGDWLVSGFSY